jgi:hypothetical protein
MTRPPVEVAEILRVQGDCFREQNRSWLGYQQLSVLRHHRMSNGCARRSSRLLLAVQSPGHLL